MESKEFISLSFGIIRLEYIQSVEKFQYRGINPFTNYFILTSDRKKKYITEVDYKKLQKYFSDRCI